MRKEDIRLKLGHRIRQLRTKHGLTQEKLSQKAGISLYYVQVLEARIPKKNATIITLEKLADAFGLPLWQFLKFDVEVRTLT